MFNKLWDLEDHISSRAILLYLVIDLRHTRHFYGVSGIRGQTYSKGKSQVVGIIDIPLWDPTSVNYGRNLLVILAVYPNRERTKQE